MAITSRQEVREAPVGSRYGIRKVVAIVAIGYVLGAGTALAGGDGRFCSATANDQFKACGKEVKDDFFVAHAKCVNVSDPGEREACLAEAQAQRREGRQLCGKQRVARKALCAALGEDRYDPDFDPANFDSDFGNLTNPNPYRPLGIGNQWQYAGGDETIVIDVLDKTKLIDDVTCIVVQDAVEKDGELIEDTFDWFAQAKNGDVYYCGEKVKDFDSFEGDNPREPELVSTDGSFKVGRDGDKAGILFLGTPIVGTVYRQEFSAGNAEDTARVLSTTYRFGNDPQLDQFVPQALANRFCLASNCVVTSEFSPMSPDPASVERKYFAPGIGLFFSVHEVTGNGVQLVNCTSMRGVRPCRRRDHRPRRLECRPWPVPARRARAGRGCGFLCYNRFRRMITGSLMRRCRSSSMIARPSNPGNMISIAAAS